MNAYSVIDHFYPDNNSFKKLLLLHSNQVREKALQILSNCKLQLDRTIVENGALLHDIGIGRCHAPSILCNGTEPYLAHGIIGAAMLRGIQDVRVPMRIALFAYIGVALPLGLALTFPMGLGAKGMWIAFVIALAIPAVLFHVRFHRQMKRLKFNGLDEID